MAFQSFFSPVNFSEFFEDLPEKLDDSKLKSAIDALNKNKYPIEKQSQEEVTELLGPILDKDLINALMAPFAILIQISSDYKELQDYFSDALSHIKNKILRKQVKKFFESLKHLDDYFSHRRLNRLKKRANRYFRNIEYSCALQGRFKQDYIYKKMPIEDYTPDFHDVVPMVSISFETSDGETESNYIFQVDEDELDEIIANLIAAQKELKLLKQRI